MHENRHHMAIGTFSMSKLKAPTNKTLLFSNVQIVFSCIVRKKNKAILYVRSEGSALIKHMYTFT